MVTRGSTHIASPIDAAIGPDEPLLESAPLAWAEAPQRCFRDPATGESCVSYHRVWQYLRLLGITTSARTNTDFLIGTFRQFARTGECSRVLVSATADYSMLAHVRSAYVAEGIRLDATVVDRCETAVLLNRWYASRYRFPLTAVCANVVEYRSERAFDVVCTHNFLSRFDPASRRRLVANWRALLRPGGVVVTTQRVMPNQPVGTNLYTLEEASALRDRMAAAARARASAEPLPVGPDELGMTAYEYAMGSRTYSIRSMGEITELFESEGFDLVLADEGSATERTRERSACHGGGGAFRMRLVARKR